MKLDKNTKHDLKVGDVLRFSDSEEYEVLRTIRSSATNSNALNLTLKCPDGRVIYGTPSSHYYGAEIISRSADTSKPKIAVLRDEIGDLLREYGEDGEPYDNGTYGYEMAKLLKKTEKLLWFCDEVISSAEEFKNEVKANNGYRTCEKNTLFIDSVLWLVDELPN